VKKNHPTEKIETMTLPKNIREQIAKAAISVTDPAGRDMAVLPEKQAENISQNFASSLREVYIAAMENGIHPHRYLRNHACISLAEQRLLARATVAVVGSGGLGGHIVLTLARIGIGRLIVVDRDVFDETNLNRQALSDCANLGAPKAKEAAKAVRAINPAVDVVYHTSPVAQENACRILAGADVVVDALDNVSDRFLIEAAARQLELPLVHGALAGFEGQVMTIFPKDAGLRNIYGERDETDRPLRALSPEAVLGVPGVTPAIVSSLQCMEVIKVLLGRGRLLRGKFLHLDLENAEFNVFSFTPDKDESEQTGAPEKE
jgi:molybdopterin-synthase adenylyltransferase